MKKIINNADQVVDEMLDGMVFAYDSLVERVPETMVIARKVEKKNKVGLVSGGGSGHEPAHAGFVGKGMLSSAVAGQVFTSPTPDQVLEGIKVADEGAGVFLVIKNYTGDVMNFEMAQELAEMEDIEVETVVVDDDIAVEDSTWTAGKRGIAGTVLVHKILGAAAEEGLSLEMEKVLQNLPEGQSAKATKILEINPQHPVFTAINNAFQDERALIKDYAKLLYDQALLIEGFSIDDPIEFSNQISSLMVKAYQTK